MPGSAGVRRRGCVSSHCQEVQQALIEALEGQAPHRPVQVLVHRLYGHLRRRAGAVGGA